MIPDIGRAAWRPGLEGWAEDILPYYGQLAGQLPAGARVVEVGVAHGRSAVYLAEQLIKHQRTDVELWCVDFWPGREFRKIVATLGGLLEEEREPGIQTKLVDLLRIVRCEGARGARLFDDGSLDAVFIDSDHEEPGMLEHLRAWLPKVKSGGRLAGHDYGEPDWPGVARAVDGFFGAEKVGRPTRSVWEVRIPQHGDHG